MAPILQQDRRTTAHYIVSEPDSYIGREQVIIASGSGKVVAGTVLAQVTATKKYVPLAPAASDGSQTAKAVLYEGCDATSADIRRVVTVRMTEVAANALVWPAGITDVQKNAALAALAAATIIAR